MDLYSKKATPATIAIIGLGQMGASYAKYATSMTTKVIVYDNNPAQRLSFKSRVINDNNPFDLPGRIIPNIKNITVVDDLDLIWRSHPDLTIITTHKDSHSYYSCLALQHGSHVLTEKPMCVDLAEAKKMHDTVLKTQKKLYIGFSLHGTAAFIKLKEIIKENQHKQLKNYQITRIGAVPEYYWDNTVTARFDLLCHDTDFCLQVFGQPWGVRVSEINARACDKFWDYGEFTVNMRGRLPLMHPKGFEYSYFLQYAEGDTFYFSSLFEDRIYLKSSNSEVTSVILLTPTSPCQQILEKVLNSITNDSWQKYLTNNLSIMNGINCINFLINDQGQ